MFSHLYLNCEWSEATGWEAALSGSDTSTDCNQAFQMYEKITPSPKEILQKLKAKNLSTKAFVFIDIVRNIFFSFVTKKLSGSESRSTVHMYTVLQTRQINLRLEKHQIITAGLSNEDH